MYPLRRSVLESSQTWTNTEQADCTHKNPRKQSSVFSEGPGNSGVVTTHSFCSVDEPALHFFPSFYERKKGDALLILMSAACTC